MIAIFRSSRRKIHSFAAIFVFGAILVLRTAAQDVKIPDPILDGLKSEDFTKRESAHSDLRSWALKKPGNSISALHLKAQVAEDPEVRARCLAVLKDVVLAKDYRSDGFLGIGMFVLKVEVPGDAKARYGIRIESVAINSAAAKAGLRVGDVIVGLEDSIWRTPAAGTDFQEKIRNTKPDSEVTLRLLNEDKVLARKVVVGEKPAGAVVPLDGISEADNQAAKDRFFRQWLDKHEAGSR